jgi:WhiB family redox-sensing transcriptional regulator
MTYDLIANEALAELATVLGIASQEGDWQERALCAQVDPELFYPEKGGSTAEAKSVCQRCEVREDCLQDALDHDDRFGIWGGLSERERRKLRPGSSPIGLNGTQRSSTGSRTVCPPTRSPQTCTRTWPRWRGYVPRTSPTLG